MLGSFRCPHCGQAYELTPQVGNQTVSCLRCQKVFQAPALPATSVPAASPWREPVAEPEAPVLQPVALAPVPSGNAQAGSPFRESWKVAVRQRRMDANDRLWLQLGLGLMGFAGLCAALLLAFRGSVATGAAVALLLVEMGGTVLMGVALRRRLPLACGIGAAALLLLVLLVEVRLPPSGPASDPQGAQTAVQDLIFGQEHGPGGRQTSSSAPSSPGNTRGGASSKSSWLEVGSRSRTADAKATANSPFSGNRPLLEEAAGLDPGRAQAASEPLSKVSTGVGSPTGSPPSANVISEGLDSTVLVEHSLASGTGFVVAKNVVVTNAHVVEGAYPDEIIVKSGDENQSPRRIRRLLHFDPQRDLCLMEVDLEAKPLPVRSDYQLHPGDAVSLLGNPSVKGGIVMRNVSNHGILRKLVHLDGQDLYHIDADINPGWSGGPVLDAEGCVLAVVVMKANDDAVAEIRASMQQLDETLRQDPGSESKGGITYGIPASALARLLPARFLRDEERINRLQENYVAQTLVGRLRTLAMLTVVRVKCHVPVRVRMEANAMAEGMMASTHRVDYVRLIPEGHVAEIRALLKSDAVREREYQFSRGLERRLTMIANSPHLSPDIKRDIKSLAAKLKEGGRLFEDPGNTYAAYSVRVGGFEREMKQLIDRLETRVIQEAR